jgi:hypothetical protein
VAETASCAASYCESTQVQRPGKGIRGEAQVNMDFPEVIIEGKLWQAADDRMQIFATGEFEPETVFEGQVTDDVADKLRRHIQKTL